MSDSVEKLMESKAEQEHRDNIDKMSHEQFNEYGDEWGNCFFNKKEAFQIGFWQGYLAAKKSDFKEIKTLKEQLQQKEEQLALAAVEFENLLNAQLANGEYEKCVALIRNALNSENQESPKTTRG